MSKQILLLLRQPPYSSSLPREALDVALAAAAFEQPLQVLFMDDGVLQLMRNQQASQIGMKDLGKTLSAFPLYDIEPLFACRASVEQRGLALEQLLPGVELIEIDEVQHKLNQHDVVLEF